MLFFIIMCILFIISVITVVLYNSDIKLKILYKKTYECDIVTINLSGFYEIIRYEIELSTKELLYKINEYSVKLEKRKIIKNKIKLKKPETIDEFIDIIEKYKKEYLQKKNEINYILKKMTFYDLSLNIKYGLLDAYLTGILYAFIYVILINIVAYIKTYYHLDLRRIYIKPIFNENVFEMEFNCIIAIKVGDIITGLKMFINSSRGSEIDGTIYRRPYENNYGKYKRDD